jgi:branched-chain amino acid transport system substrate-binding protein
MTRRSLAVLLLLTLVLALLAACGGEAEEATTTAPASGDSDTGDTATDETGDTTAQAPSGEPIKIGVITSLTGPLAATGVQVATGVRAAAQEWNDRGGVNGRPVEVLVEDDASTPNGSVNAFNTLLSQEPAFFVGPTFTPLIMPLEPILVEQAQTPFFTSATGTIITKSGDGWFFRLRTNDEQSASILAEFALEDLDAERPGLIYPNNDYGKSGMEVMQQVMADEGVEFVAIETFNQGTDKDVTAQLNKIKSAGADVLLSWTVPVDSGMINVQALQVGMDMPIAGSPGFGTPEYLSLAGESSEGVYALIDSTAGQDEASKEWADGIRADFPNTPVSFVVSAQYDATNMALQAIADGAEGAEALRDAVAAITDYQGITGTYSFDEEHNGLHQGVIGQWQSQQFVEVKKIVRNP